VVLAAQHGQPGFQAQGGPVQRLVASHKGYQRADDGACGQITGLSGWLCGIGAAATFWRKSVEFEA
jgi:hypothetical protein